MRDNELLREKISSLEERISEITASRDVQQMGKQSVVNKLVAAEPKWRQIRLAVLLPALIASVGIAIQIILERQPGIQVDPINNTVTIYHHANPILFLIGFGLVVTMLTISQFLIPLPFGLLAGLAWPGRHPKGYTLLGFFVGLLTLIGSAVSHILLIEEGQYHFLQPRSDPGLAAIGLQGWMVLIGFFLLGPALLFLSGGLFADLIKTRTSPHGARESGIAGKVAARLSGPEKEPNKKMILFIKVLGPSVIALAGSLVSLTGTILTVFLG